MTGNMQENGVKIKNAQQAAVNSTSRESVFDDESDDLRDEFEDVLPASKAATQRVDDEDDDQEEVNHTHRRGVELDQRGRRLDPRDSIRPEPDEREYKPAMTLDAPEPPPGFLYRWVNTLEKKILARRLQERWTPVMLDEVPPEFQAPTLQHGMFSGAVEIEGQVLMKNTVENVRKRNTYYRKKREDALQVVDQQLAEEEEYGSRHRMRFRNKSSTTIIKGKPKKVRVADERGA